MSVERDSLADGTTCVGIEVEFVCLCADILYRIESNIGEILETEIIIEGSAKGLPRRITRTRGFCYLSTWGNGESSAIYVPP